MKVLFVCTGNIFRSMSADLSLRKYLADNDISEIQSHSAGIQMYSGPPEKLVSEELTRLGIDWHIHIPRQVTKEILDESDLVIAMGNDHKEYLKKHFNVDALYFNKIVYDKDEPILDVHEAIPDWYSTHKDPDNILRKTVLYIHDSIPIFVKNLKEKSENY